MTYEEERAEALKSRRGYRREFESWIKHKRPWAYWITLTYRDPYYGTESATFNHLMKWAKACQPLLKLPTFEYAFIPEHVDQGRFDHLHGVLYVESTGAPILPQHRKDAKARLFEFEWKHGFATVEPYDEFKDTGYMMKDYGATVPFFLSPTMGDGPAKRPRKPRKEGTPILMPLGGAIPPFKSAAQRQARPTGSQGPQSGAFGRL